MNMFLSPTLEAFYGVPLDHPLTSQFLLSDEASNRFLLTLLLSKDIKIWLAGFLHEGSATVDGRNPAPPGMYETL